jgi:hypothetical protein
MHVGRLVFGCILAILVAPVAQGEEMKEAAAVREAVTFYASFDEAVAGDRGGGELKPGTRLDHPEQKGAFVFEPGFDAKVFRIAPGKGISGGALEVVDVLPRRGRVFFPARGNLAYTGGDFSGAVSFWINTDPNRALKTPFCDPIQITHKGANNGGLWIDFPDVRPRDLRLGAFSGVPDGAVPIKESDPQAPLIVVKQIGFQNGQWHHVAFTWRDFDTGKPNAHVTLYLDGKPAGELADREIAMRWDLDKTGIYVAVNYIGLLDELALFRRELTAEEIALLYRQPNLPSE